jgi:hypothetical protein
MFFKFVQENFQTQGGAHSDGSLAWRELADSTKAWKAKHKYSPLALIRTGALRQHWTFDYTRAFGVLKTVGTPYAQFHEEGAGKLPQRKMLPTEQQAYEIANETFRKFVDDATQ